MIVGIDFDGTIVEHKYPKVGDPVPHALRVMRRILANEHQIILWTMRSGETLRDATRYLEDNSIEIYGANKNPDQDWSTSPKAYCHIYIDDAALGCPLTLPSCELAPLDVYSSVEIIPSRPYVDWLSVEKELTKKNYFMEI